MHSLEELSILSVVMGLIILCSILGNLMVLISFKASKTVRRNPSNFLILNLATADFLSACIVMPFQMTIFIQPGLVRHGGTACTLAGVLSYPFFIVSVFSLVMLSFERYLALGSPLKHLRMITPRVVMIMVAYPWFHSVCYALGSGLGFDIKFDTQTMDCGLGWKDRHIAFVLFTGLVHVVFPFIALVALNTRTLLRVRSQRQRGTQLQASCNRNVLVNQRREGQAKLTKLALTIILVFLLCWSPYLLTRLLSLCSINAPVIVQTGAVWILHLHSVANPVVYTCYKTSFRKVIYELLVKRPAHATRISVTSSQMVMTVRPDGLAVAPSPDSTPLNVN